MMWVPFLALALLAFAIAVFAARLPRNGWALFGATLLFGLSGYAMQGSPAEPGSPTMAPKVDDATNAAMVDARRQMFGADHQPSRFVTIADGFARRGKYQDAANLLRNAVEENPKDGEAWLALGNALVEHADGMLTPAAIYAFVKAETILPGNPAPPYFLGVALLRSGRPQDARQLWKQTLDNAPKDASWKPLMQERLKRLDDLIAQMGVQ